MIIKSALKVGTLPRVPVSLMDKVKEKLAQMEEMAVVSKIEKPTEWMEKYVSTLPNSMRECAERDIYYPQ